MSTSLATRLSDLRRAHGLSQDTVAEHLGIARQSVSKWERGETTPDSENLIALAQLYGTSLDDLLGLSPAPATATPSPAAPERRTREAPSAPATSPSPARTSPCRTSAAMSAAPQSLPYPEHPLRSSPSARGEPLVPTTGPHPAHAPPCRTREAPSASTRSPSHSSSCPKVPRKRRAPRFSPERFRSNSAEAELRGPAKEKTGAPDGSPGTTYPS